MSEAHGLGTGQVASKPPRLASARQLARNATLNLISEGILFAVVLAAIPILLRYLGENNFGLFSLAWVVIGYFTLFDIGVSRAATKFISEHLSQGNLEAAQRIALTTLMCNLVLGMVAGTCIILAAPFLVRVGFRVPWELQDEGRQVWLAIGLAVPVLLLQGALRAILSSYQRFGWINLVNIAVTIGQWGVACWFAWKDHGVAIVVASTVGVRFVGVCVFTILLIMLLQHQKFPKLCDLKEVLRLARFGGWVTISQVISPILVYIDRIFIASFVSLAAVGFYTVPFEALFRLRIFPASLTATTYPAFSERLAVSDYRGVSRLYQHSILYMIVLLLPILILISIFGGEILGLWMGRSFADRAAPVLPILAFGVLLNCLATIPLTMIHALGRPGLSGKIHLAELPVYIVLCSILIPTLGIVGAAYANTFRVGLDALLLFRAVSGVTVWLPELKRMWLFLLASSVFLCLMLLAVRTYCHEPWVQVLLISSAMSIYLVVVWLLVFGVRERATLIQAFWSSSET